MFMLPQMGNEGPDPIYSPGLVWVVPGYWWIVFVFFVNLLDEFHLRLKGCQHFLLFVIDISDLQQF